jgi:hypothetical protein
MSFDFAILRIAQQVAAEGGATGDLEMDVTTTTEPKVTPAPAGMTFFAGALTRLRPVLAADLPRVVELLSASPRNIEDEKPWTVARLKKKFEDEKEPGLWGKEKRWYLVVTPDEAIIGVLIEDQNRSGEIWLDFSFDMQLADRDSLALDGLRTYLRYKRDYHNIPRAYCFVLDVQLAELKWLKQLDFIYQAQLPQCVLHLGERHDALLYAWIADWVIARRAPDGGASE